MAGVYFCSHTNSTFFTTCCELAVVDGEDDCPGCGEEVFPKGRKARWDSAMEKLYGRKRLREMRDKGRRRMEGR